MYASPALTKQNVAMVVAVNDGVPYDILGEITCHCICV